MKSAKILILFAAISAVQCGGPSPCEPFVSNFQAFLQPWLGVINQFQSLAVDISTAHPVFAPAFVEGVKCRASVAIEFVAKVISLYSGINEHDVLSFLEGTSSPDFWTPLECITGEINLINQRISHIVSDVVESLEDLAQPGSTPNDCVEVNSTLASYKELGVNVSKQLGDILRNNRQVFMSLGLEDFYVANLISLTPCLHQVMGIGLGSLLNADGNAVTQFMSGEIGELPYPFSCAEFGLTFIRNHFYQDFSDLYYGSIDSFDFIFTGRD